MAGKGGGAWKVAYADFVTAMMAFFMVMWLVSQNEEIKNAVAQHFREPPGVFDFDKHTGRGGKRGYRTTPEPALFTPPPVEMEETSKSSLPRILKIHNHGDQHIGVIILFPGESAEVDETAQEQLRQIAPLFVGKPQKIEIRGHASRKPLSAQSPYRDAWELSYARCVATMNFLAEQGIPRERLRLSQAGATEPFSVMPNAAQQACDARVEVFILAEFAEDLVGTPEERARLYQTP